MRVFSSCTDFFGLRRFLPRGQDACTVALNEAQDKFESGKLYEVPDTIESCIRRWIYHRSRRIAAYRLMTITYLYLNYYDKADSTYLKLVEAYRPSTGNR
jgi:hypothetical protein